MSPREKRLLIFFAAAGFIVLNVLGFNFYQKLKIQTAGELAAAKLQLQNAEAFSASREQVAAEMDWLNEHQPPEAAKQDVQTKLQQFCEQQAKSVGLVIKNQKAQPYDETEGRRYHRARFEFTVNGTEEALYKWFDSLNIPEQMRIATLIRLEPNKQDDTKIDCTAVVEQWFTPIPPSA